MHFTSKPPSLSAQFGVIKQYIKPSILVLVGLWLHVFQSDAESSSHEYLFWQNIMSICLKFLADVGIVFCFLVLSLDVSACFLKSMGGIPTLFQNSISFISISCVYNIIFISFFLLKKSLCLSMSFNSNNPCADYKIR